MTPAALAQRKRVIAEIAERRRAATHCKRGHEFTPENTYIHHGRRRCRTCKRDGDFYWSRGLSIRMFE